MKSDVLAYLDRAFPNLYSRIHVRFELGEPFDNGTDDRLNQVNSRVVNIFKCVFNDEDEIYIMIKDWMKEIDIKFRKATPTYIYELLAGKVYDEGIYYEVDEDIDDEGKMISQEFPCKISIVKDKVNQIPFESILKGISYNEQGRRPSIEQEVYFISVKKNLLFYMYDDRGCIVFGTNANDLRILYEKFNDWIVEYWRKSIDEIFSLN